MPQKQTSQKERRVRQWISLLAIGFLLAHGAGCATAPTHPNGESRRALQSIPEIRGDDLRADRALVTAFFAANGITISTAQAKEIIPDIVLQGQINRRAIRRTAKKHGYRVVVIKADETFLWEELGRNLPLLLLLPPGIHYSPSTTPLLPIAWDRKERTLDLLDGNGEIRTLSENDFFNRREPLKQAAICLVKPNGFRHFEPTRKQKLLLADFWFDQNFYRRAHISYTAMEPIPPIGKDIDAFIRHGDRMIRKGRYAEAIPFFRAALALDPDNPKILNNLAYTMLRGDGELLVALRHATKAARIDPYNPLILETLGTINLRVGDAEAAVQYLEHALARSLKRSPEIQIAIIDQLIRAWLAADCEDLAWEIARYRHQTYMQYRFPADILNAFPALSRTRLLLEKNIMPEEG